jgi:putative ABC transport system permease protein
MGKRFWRKLLFLFQRSRFDEELAEEMRLHMELRAGKMRSPDAARKRFGNVTQALESSRDAWTWRWLEETRQDLRFASRLLRKKPAFTAIAAITLALGIGASTAVFSIVEAVLLRPLPYRDPGRLVAIWDSGTRERRLSKVFGPYTDYEEWSRHARSFESIAALTWGWDPSRIMTGRGAAKELLAIPASATFFDTLGVSAALGRTFTSADERHGCTIVLAHSFWTTDLGSDSAIVGHSLNLDQRACTVAGVMPPGFSFYPPETNLWMLLGPDFQPPREKMTVGIFARLKPGVRREQAQSEIVALSRAAHPSGFWHDFEPRVYDLHGEFTFLASRTLRLTLIVAFCAVLLVLAIAALNVANLLLARLAERQRELAVRAALGSGRARLVRQVLTESLLLSAIGTLGGIAIAFGAVRYFRHAAPITLTVGSDVRIDLPVLIFTILAALATTLAFGLLPALSISRSDLFERLKAAGRGALNGALRRRAAGTMVALEMGLSFLLLIGAGLLLASALRMGSEPLGFNPHRLFETHTMLPMPRYRDAARREQYYDALLDGLRRMPGVAGAALTSALPPNLGNAASEAIELQGSSVAESFELHDVGVNSASPGFFSVLGMPLLEGRAFAATDQGTSEPVVIINQALQREYFPRGNPLGRRIRLAPGSATPWMTIVGVVGDLKHTELMNEMGWAETPILYQPVSQTAPQGFEIAIRARAVGPAFEHRIQEQIAALDASVPINPVEPVNADISKTLAYPRFRAMVLGFFSLTALLLSAVGLNGVLSQIVAQRIPEFGIRKAMGAQQRDLLLLVARQGGIPVALGMAGGIGCALLFSWLLRALLYGVDAADPKVIALVAALFLGIAATAIALPARRAALVDPMAALRDE